MSYNYNIAHILYDDDEGYQSAVCKLFSMEEYNDETVSKVLDLIYFNTKDQPLFQVV